MLGYAVGEIVGRFGHDFIFAVHGAAAAINAVTVRFLMLPPSPMHLALAL